MSSANTNNLLNLKVSSIGITLDTYSHVTPSMQEEVASMAGSEFEKARLSKDCQTKKQAFSNLLKALILLGYTIV